MEHSLWHLKTTVKPLLLRQSRTPEGSEETGFSGCVKRLFKSILKMTVMQKECQMVLLLLH